MPYQSFSNRKKPSIKKPPAKTTSALLQATPTKAHQIKTLNETIAQLIYKIDTLHKAARRTHFSSLRRRKFRAILPLLDEAQQRHEEMSSLLETLTMKEFYEMFEGKMAIRRVYEEKVKFEGKWAKSVKLQGCQIGEMRVTVGRLAGEDVGVRGGVGDTYGSRSEPGDDMR